MTLLTPTQASEIVGVPTVQLCRWAYLGQGPRNSGTKHKPMFDEDDLALWRKLVAEQVAMRANMREMIWPRDA
jgi:hypothetical protein